MSRKHKSFVGLFHHLEISEEKSLFHKNEWQIDNNILESIGNDEIVKHVKIMDISGIEGMNRRKGVLHPFCS